MLGLGTTEIVIISIAMVVLFGAKRIPELAKSVGLSVNAFKSGLRHIEKNVGDLKKPPQAGGDRQA